MGTLADYDLLPNVTYNEAANRWMYVAGSGKSGFVSETAIRSELQSHMDGLKVTLANLTKDLYSGGLSLADWQAAVAIELKNAHLAQAIFGAGGLDKMTQSAYGRVGQTLREQYGFLARFAQGIADGSVSEGQALLRVGMYGDASQQSYWDALRAEAKGVGSNDLPILRQSPRDGNTQCITNCLCSLEIHSDGVYWILDGGEHCPDCQALAAGGPYRIP